MKIRIMKQSNGFRALFSIATLMVLFTIFNINSAYAVEPSASPSPTPESSPRPNPTPYKKPLTKTNEEREAFRDKIHEVLDMVTDATNTITPETSDSTTNPKSSSQKRLGKAKEKLDAVKDEDLETLMDGINPAELEIELAEAKAKIEKIKPMMADAWGHLASQPTEYGDDKTSTRNISKLSSPLPQIGGPDQICAALIGAGHAGDEVVLAAKAALLVTKIINIASDRACGQVVVAGVVVLGNGGVGGGNPSLACIVSDGLLFAAEQLVDKITSCDNEFTARSVDTAVARMATVHTDIESSRLDVIKDAATNRTTVTDAVTIAKNFVDGNATTNKNTIVNNDNENKDTIVGTIGAGTVIIQGAVSDGTAALIGDNLKNKNTIVANDNTNKDAVVDDAKVNKTLLLRMQIEADLSSTDGATFVAMFLTPKTVCAPVLDDKGEVITGTEQCGYLDFARGIVVQTIGNLAGANAATANAFLAKGDTHRLARDYKQAYQNYRLAYKTAAGISTR
jgi:hypothetical protein